jgi:hypothetical protein
LPAVLGDVCCGLELSERCASEMRSSVLDIGATRQPLELTLELRPAAEAACSGLGCDGGHCCGQGLALNAYISLHAHADAQLQSCRSCLCLKP